MLTMFAQAASTAVAADPKPWYHTGALGYMLDGGLFMWPILLLAVLGMGVVIERFRSLRLIAADNQAFRLNVLRLLHADKVGEALGLCARSRGPVPAILAVGLHRYEMLRDLNAEPARLEEQVVKAMDDYGVHITAALERNLPVLATVASVAPMLGSLGTVVGMVSMFEGIVTTYGKQDIILAAAAGIKLKLIVTVWGLMVGIPAYIFYNYFSTVVNRFILEAEEAATGLVEAVTFRHARPAVAAVAETRPTQVTGGGG